MHSSGTRFLAWREAKWGYIGPQLCPSFCPFSLYSLNQNQRPQSRLVPEKGPRASSNYTYIGKAHFSGERP